MLLQRLQMLPVEVLEKKVAVSTMGCNAVIAEYVGEQYFEATYGESVGEITNDKRCDPVILIN